VEYARGVTATLIIPMMIIGLLVGVAKTAIGGLGLLSVVLLAQVMPAKESTGVLLILLIVGDLFAIGVYKKHVEWKFLKTLIWPVLFGFFMGAFYLFQSTDNSLKKTIGIVVVLLVALYPASQYWQRHNEDISTRFPKTLRIFLGTSAGFMSMVANSGGTPMSIYILLRRKSVFNFLGNTAWFFFIVNIAKLPFTLTLGLLDFNSLHYILPAIPMVALGALLGKKIISRIDQQLFQNMTLVSAALVGLKLIFF
jgi:uncharacterized membrane protein YfcA